MLPFQLPFRNQNQARGGNDPYLNQFPTESSVVANQFGFNNPQNLIPTPGGLHSQNVLLGGLLAQQHLIQQLQNNFIASLTQQGAMPQLHGQQINLLGGFQKPNLMTLQPGGFLGRPPLSQNQMMGFSPNGFLCPQNSNFAPNSQLPVMIYGNSNPIFSGNDNPQIAQSTNIYTNNETQSAKQKLQVPVLPCTVQSNQSCGQQRAQTTHSRAAGKNFSSNPPGNVSKDNFKTKFNESKEGKPSHMRSQKSQSSSSSSAWKKKSFSRIDVGGQQQKHEKKTKFLENNDNASIRSSQAVIYNEGEVQRWREARKKNFPTRNKIELKLILSSAKKKNVDSEAKTRVQELKEVLAKQAELGVRVAEIPSIYRTEKRERFRHNNSQNTKKLKSMKKAPLLEKERSNTSEPEEPAPTANKASSTDTQPNRSNTKRGMFRRDKKGAKKLKVKKKATKPSGCC